MKGGRVVAQQGEVVVVVAQQGEVVEVVAQQGEVVEAERGQAGGP